MKRSSVKETFGGEVAFTKFIATDKDTSDRLLESISMELGDYNVIAEDRTLDGKRADLVVRENDKVMAVIEAQDASGWLDSVHSSKITYYMFEKECNTGVLICEDADEHLKGYIKYLNENTPFNIYIVYARVYNNKYIDFVSVMRPFSPKQKKITSKKNDGSTWLANFVTEKRSEYSDIFVGNSMNYLPSPRLGEDSLAVVIGPRKGGKHVVEVYHQGKLANSEIFDKTFTQFVNDKLNRNVHTKNKNAHRIQTQNWDDTLECFKKLSNAVETNVIKGD